MKYFKLFLDKFLCLHDWKEIKQIHDILWGEYKLYTEHHFVCKKCGKFKKRKM